MSEVNIFEKASRKQLRFTTQRGKIATEDLWTLDLPALNELAKEAARKVRESDEEDFIETRKTRNTEAELQLAILKRVIAVRIAERDASKAAATRRVQIANLRAIAAQKAGDALNEKSLDEINAMISELENEASTSAESSD